LFLGSIALQKKATYVAARASVTVPIRAGASALPRGGNTYDEMFSGNSFERKGNKVATPANAPERVLKDL
jgi:hypothetical protein